MEADTSTMNPRAAEIDLALSRATLYSALALAFRPPTQAVIARIVEPENSAALAEAAALLDPEDGALLAPAVTALVHKGQIGLDPLASAYRALFGHTARGAVPPYETEYGNEALFQQPQEMGDLMGFYRAFGLTVKLGEHERPDHVSCECEFLAFLSLKEAYALEHDDEAMLEETRKAQKFFLKDHLGRFISTFSQKLGQEDPSGFYAALAEISLHLVAQESLRLKVTLAGPDMALRPTEDDRVPMACGSGAECTAMPGACIPEGADSV